MQRLHIAICLIVITTITACKKDNGFGSGSLPSESTLDLILDDNNEIEAITKFEDPLRTDRLLFNYLGHIDHPVFGKTTAKTTAQYGLPDNIELAKAPFEVKKAELYLFYDAFYGDTTAPVSISVKRLSSPINNSVTYRSNYIPSYATESLGELNDYLLKPNTPQSFRDDDSIAFAGFVKIPIDIDYARELRDLLETGLITNDTLFNNRFPGLFIETTSAQPGKTMIQLDMTHIASGLYVTLSDKDDKEQTLVLPFTSTKFVHTFFSHDYEGTRVKNVIEDGLNNPDGKLYMQSQAGVKTEVKFLDLEKYKNKLINKAVLEIYEVENPVESFLRVLSVYPLKKGSTGKNVAVNDYLPDFYGPAYMDSSNVNGSQLRKFEINITDLFKNYALGKNDFESIYLTNYPVFLEQPKFIINESSVKSNNIEPATLIFGSPNYSDPQKRMKLKVWYTNKK